jgi:hypothetical protein
MTVYLVFTTMLDRTSFVGAYQTREIADETVRMLKRIVGKEYWVIEEPVVTKLYQIA